MHGSPRPWARVSILAALLFALLAPRISAQNPFESEEAAAQALAKAAQAQSEAAKPEFPSIAEVTKDHEKIDGFFPLYKKGEKLYMALESGKRDKLFLLAVSVAGGPQFAGFQWDEMAVQWERLEKNILLVRPNLLHKAQDNTPLAHVVGRTFTSSIVLSTPIVAMDGDTALIDLTWVFKADFAQLSGAVAYVGGGHYQLNPELSRWTTTKGFPQNSEIGVEAAFLGGGGGFFFGGGGGDVADSRGVRMLVHYSLSELPQNGYSSREADDRVGYFLTAVKDYSRDHASRGMFRRLIHRWNLEKLDPSLDVSPPKKPIIFYIEKTVPIPYRRWIKEGILEWNRAFEKVGFIDAIQVRQQTENNEFAHLDPEDVRYNFFRWITTGSPFAMGPSRVNPLTGEILDADILMDDSYVRFMLEESGVYAGSAARALLDDPKFEKFLAANPEMDPFQRSAVATKGVMPEPRLSALRNPKMLELMERRGRSLCTYAAGKSRQMALAHVISWIQSGAGAGGKVSPEFIGEFIKETVMHEVGHTLGLRHNFKASSWRTLDEINAAERPADTSGSVMDYNPTNWVVKGRPQGHYAMTTIGPYDYWAIEYGYRTQPAPAKEGETAPSDEAGMLKQILSRVAEKGLAFATDEETSFLDPDPLANRWDLGADPVAFARHRTELVNELLKDLVAKVVPEGEDYHLAKKAFNALLFERMYASLIAIRNVGGQNVNRDHKGDTNARPPFVILPAAKQREALQFVFENLYGENAFSFDPALLNHLAPGRWMHWGSDEADWRLDYPIHDQVNRFQTVSLSLLLNAWTLHRIYDAEIKIPAGEDAVTVAEIFQGLRKAVWSELDRPGIESGAYTERKPFVNSIRRMLQREYLELMVRIGLQPAWHAMFPADVPALAWDSLSQLAVDLEKAVAAGKNLDGYSRAHLKDSLARVQEALKARYMRR